MGFQRTGEDYDARNRAAKDTRIVNGARCVWWGTIQEVSAKPSGLPCCPHCGGVLFETESIDWWKAVDRHDERNPGYRQLIEFIRGKHFRTWTEAEAALHASALEEKPADPVKALSEVLRNVGALPTLDPHRSLALPCYLCGTTTVPRSLVDVGLYTRHMGGNLKPGDKITRPMCDACVALSDRAESMRRG